jgi:uncharacterized membrane protein
MHATLVSVKAIGEHPAPVPRLPETKTQRLFYSAILPAGVIANLVLGLIVLSGLNPGGYGWLQLATGAFCCMIAGWLAAAIWSKAYWNRNMARQVAVWRRIADAFFAWLEDAPLPPEALHRLKSSLDEVVPTAE